MNKFAIVLTVLLLLFCVGCKKSSTKSEPKLWNVQQLWARGSHPVPSPTGTAVLFMQEEAPAGLYLLQNGAATLVTADNPAPRSDYAWSSDGARFCFSAPGQPGDANAGIYLASLTSPTTLTRLWDRGSSPRFLPGTEGIVCAGPEDTTAGAGLYQLGFSPGNPVRLIRSGLQPEISPDGSQIAYYMVGTDTARTLWVIDRTTSVRSVVDYNVVRYSWLSDSRTLAYEKLVNGSPVIAVKHLGSDGTIIANGTDPRGFPTGGSFVFTALNGDQLDGLFTASLTQAPVRITHTGAQPFPSSASRVVAQDNTGLLEITAP